MEDEDYSRIIYDTYFSSDKPLKITLKNGKVLEGKLIGVFHGEPDTSDPFVVRWHFLGLGEKELDPIAEGEPGAFLNQEDIQSVELKEQ